MTERLLTTDLSGGEASADSFARSIADLVAEYVVDFRFDAFSSFVLGLTVSSEGFINCLSCSVPVADCVGSRAALSELRGKVVRWVLPDTLVHVLLGSWFFEVEGVGVGEIEDSIPRFGCE